MKRIMEWLGIILVLMVMTGCGSGGSKNESSNQEQGGGGSGGSGAPPSDSGSNAGNTLPLEGGGSGGSSLQDTTPPTIEIQWISSEPDNLLGRVNTIECIVADDTGVESVNLYIDGFLNSSQAVNDPCQIDINGEALSLGEHSIGIQSYDKAGNASVLATIVVRADFGELRKRGLQFLRDFNLRHDPMGNAFGGVRRWATMPMIIKVSPEMLQENPDKYQKKIAWIKKYIHGVDYIVQQGDLNAINNYGEDGVIYAQYGVLGEGKGGGAWSRFGDCTVDASVITINKEDEDQNRVIIHEILHTTPLPHVTSETIMNGSALILRMDPVMAEAISILYTELQPCDEVPAQ